LEEVSFVSQPDASDNGGPDANSPGASAEQALVEVPQESPLEALQRKFASFKVTPVSK
jgi:hypothetical protein